MRDTVKCGKLFTTSLQFFYHSVMFSLLFWVVSSFFLLVRQWYSFAVPTAFLLFLLFVLFCFDLERRCFVELSFQSLYSLGFFSFLLAASISMFFLFSSLLWWFYTKVCLPLIPLFSPSHSMLCCLIQSFITLPNKQLILMFLRKES